MCKILTISVAVYNVENYLEKCLSSFADDRFIDKLEVLVINDGSKDRSQEIAEKYVSNYPQIFKLINKQNGGYGTTFHVGFEEASGKYYKVVDGDDYVDTEALVLCLDELINCNSDVVITEYSKFDNQNMNNRELVKYNLRNLSYGEEYQIEKIVSQIDTWFVCNIIYKTELLKNRDYTLGEKYYVDMEYDIYPLFKSKTITFFPMSITQYRTNQGTNSTSKSALLKHANELMSVTYKILDYISNHPLNDKSRLDFIYRFSSALFSATYFAQLLRPFKSDSYKQIKSLSKKIRCEYQGIYDNATFPMRVLYRFPFLYIPMSILCKLNIKKI